MQVNLLSLNNIFKFTKKSSLIWTLVFVVALQNTMSLAAKKNKPGTVTNLEQYTSLEKVFQSNQDSVELFAKKLDLEKEEISKIDFYLNATNLLAKTKYPQTIRFKAYTKNLDGKTAIVKVVDSTVFNSREAQALFINLLVPESFQSEDLYIDIYDSNLDLAASFKHFVTKTATASSQSIDAASCSQSNFGECNLDYILNAIDFELVPGKEAQSVISNSLLHHGDGFHVLFQSLASSPWRPPRP